MQLLARVAARIPIASVQALAQSRLQRAALAALPREAADASDLARGWDGARLAATMASPRAAAEWEGVEREAAALAIPAQAHGVNPGDRRALYHLVRALGSRSVLEVGTHIGASTVHLAAALRDNAREAGGPWRLTTVDIEDVNDAAQGPWRRFGSPASPRELIERVAPGGDVRFVAEPSLSFLARTAERFDFVFLDGDHAAATVYRELPAALRVLEPGGAVLLHDYFPGERPLWSNGVVLPGPWLGTERLKAEGAAFEVHPLGELPWPTKLGSNVTSLALVTARP
jgi:predicted O-methyltransferase YrrM